MRRFIIISAATLIVLGILCAIVSLLSPHVPYMNWRWVMTKDRELRLGMCCDGQTLRFRTYNHGSWSEFYFPEPSDIHVFTFPCIIFGELLLLTLLPAKLRADRQSRRRAAGLCPICTYNLTGNTSGVCPECGTNLLEYDARQCDGKHPVRE